jgi:toxin ParE1/3/4
VTVAVIIRPAAQADLRDVFATLEKTRAGLGARFLKQVNDVLEHIEWSLSAYGVIWRYVRAARLKRMRYVVYYIVFVDRVEVIAIMHGARRASAWKSRK